ncbi:hypothetical protein BJ508DRAFT_302282 [Ascobolus immersus RN42]|uniref:Reverse transcriptase RNase H-like domain-containing protein n=1 Tax=Ascobolus immersus RN42 TaxID=1160509 RepID=A0A3N4IID7_ASCIM|nr:hypothetical protein BJ508DRAFT_302282 [Ascobolus immersus RN42]
MAYSFLKVRHIVKGATVLMITDHAPIKGVLDGSLEYNTCIERYRNALLPFLKYLNNTSEIAKFLATDNTQQTFFLAHGFSPVMQTTIPDETYIKYFDIESGTVILPPNISNDLSLPVIPRQMSIDSFQAEMKVIIEANIPIAEKQILMQSCRETYRRKLPAPATVNPEEKTV